MPEWTLARSTNLIWAVGSGSAAVRAVSWRAGLMVKQLILEVSSRLAQHLNILEDPHQPTPESPRCDDQDGEQQDRCPWP